MTLPANFNTKYSIANHHCIKEEYAMLKNFSNWNKSGKLSGKIGVIFWFGFSPDIRVLLGFLALQAIEEFILKFSKN
jgi:hypothetical protein